MDQEMRERSLALFREVRRDREYAALSEEYNQLHDEFCEAGGRLPGDGAGYPLGVCLPVGTDELADAGVAM